jgi:hypothetical protein
MEVKAVRETDSEGSQRIEIALESSISAEVSRTGSLVRPIHAYSFHLRFFLLSTRLSTTRDRGMVPFRNPGTVAP